MKASEFIHPEDAAALRQMESIPGFAALVKKVMAIGGETLQYGINMASAVRLSEKQLPELYRHLPPICEQLGIPEPEFYLQMNPVPNAWTAGDTRIYITMTSALVEMMSEEELVSVLAHECGHIVCHHVLYHTVGTWLANGIASTGLLGTMTAGLQYAMFYWSRKSELSADRCASIVTSPEMVARVQARLSAGPKDITEKINLEEWAKQADEYDSIKNDGLWNKTLQMVATADRSHPFSAVRVREILKWGNSEQYRRIMAGFAAGGKVEGNCPRCGMPVDEDWKFCRHCGCKL